MAQQLKHLARLKTGVQSPRTHINVGGPPVSPVYKGRDKSSPSKLASTTRSWFD